MILSPFLLTLGLAATPAPAPATDIVAGACHLGEVAPFSQVACSIAIANHGDKPVTLALSALQPEDAISPTALRIAPGHSAAVSIHVAIGNASGPIMHDFRIHSAGASDRDQFVVAKGFALSALDVPYPQIAFGEVFLASGDLEKNVELNSHDAATFRVTRVIEVPHGIETRISPDGHTVTARIRPDATWGLFNGDIKLAIDTPRQKQAWVRVSGVIRGDVTTAQNPYWFGGLAAGHDRSLLVPLTDREGRDFRIGTIDVKNTDARATVVPCQPASKGCKAIRVTFSDQQPPGVTRGELQVDFPDLHRKLHLRIWGILQPPGASDGEAEADEHAPWTPSIVESVNAPVYATPVESSRKPDVVTNAPVQPPPGNGPLLKWVAEEERAVHGYQIFRADSESGPFVLLNQKTIPARGYAHASYQWRDTSAIKGHTYWYYIGIVAKDGQKKSLSKPLKAVAK